MSNVMLLSVGTAVPPHQILQRDAAAAAHEGFAHRFPDFERLARVFQGSGIRTRYSVRPIEWLVGKLGWPERNAAYIVPSVFHPDVSAVVAAAVQTAARAAGATPRHHVPTP